MFMRLPVDCSRERFRLITARELDFKFSTNFDIFQTNNLSNILKSLSPPDLKNMIEFLCPNFSTCRMSNGFTT